MEKKTNLFKSIFYIFFALCFVSLGANLLGLSTQTKISYAENLTEEEIDNQNIPSYFLAQEYLNDGSTATLNENSLIDSNIFMFYKEGSTASSLKLSLDRNNGNFSSEEMPDIYKYCYYPDRDNLSIFNFYSINSISLYINGEYQNLETGNYIISSGMSFANKASAQLDGFEMNFVETNTKANEISIIDESTGEVKEGVYTLSLTFALYTCTDGGVSGIEEEFTDENVTINYSFYVLSRDKYLLNNKPFVDYKNFDHDISITNTTNSNAYLLYGNYSAEGKANKIPYIEYDYTRFELSIAKDFSSVVSTCSLVYDKDIASISKQGDLEMTTSLNESQTLCRVYFVDVGEYTITLKAIKLVENAQDATLTKHSLSGLTNITKKIKVHMFGYQATYTDMDKPVDENNVRPTSELKTANLESGLFTQSADITSSFMASNPYNDSTNPTGYSQETGDTTFLIGNVLNYLNKNDTDDKTIITPVKTNQTPIKLSANATLSTSRNSYILSTTKVSNSYEKYEAGTLGGQTLYRATFSGRTDSTAGTYIYIIAYSYKNYYSTESTLSANKVFYQVFYFEIVKDLPTISVYQENDNNSVISSDTFVNQNVVIDDKTKNEPYNKKVTIQIYAKDYNNKTYLQGFGGENGISFDSLSPVENKISLTVDAHYTVRLYYSSEITATNILLSATKGFFREQTFTIDKSPIQNISGRNVSEVLNSTDYKIISTMDSFTTNQSFVLSWAEKNSGARTFAYYRYFPIVDAQYYSNKQATVSATIQSMLKYSTTNSYLPVNNILNLSTENNSWLPYKGNTEQFAIDSQVSTEYALTDAGLYLVDVYDEAGNHSIEVFLFDNSSPLFAITETGSGTYELTSSSMYVTNPSTLFWAKYKGLYIAKFSTLPYNSSYNSSNVTADNLKDYDFYKAYDGETICVDIFKTMYDRLFAQSYMQFLTCTVSANSASDNISDLINGYSGYYMTIPINPISYFTDIDHNSFTMQENIYSKDLSVDNEMTYTVLIRDLSNTKYDLNYSHSAVFQYTKHYSAKQTIIVSFDSSEFAIEYTNSNRETEILTSNNFVEGTEIVDGVSRKIKTTYLNPTRLEKPFVLSFLPTKIDGDMNIQVDKVTIKYYPYKESTIKKDGVTYHYYELSSNATETTVYDFPENEAMTEVKKDEIRLNAQNITTAGKYEISRTYYVDSEGTYSYNENDFYARTYVLYVDRNEVVSNAELVNDENGSHLESLVGGDVFVAMYNNKTNADLVVTFPNSEQGNSNGSSIYNNGIVKSVLTTNMLPVNVYIPQYKYTINTDKKLTETGYDFEVNTSGYYQTKTDAVLFVDDNLETQPDEAITLDSGTFLDIVEKTSKSTKIKYNNLIYYVSNDNVEFNTFTMNNYVENSLIVEYALFAELYKDGKLLAVTSTNSTNPTLGSVVADNNGFLNFYYTNGQKLKNLSEAGTYSVKVFQGKFGTGTGDNNYEQCLEFCFEIQKSNPDFEIKSITGSSLNSDTNNYYYTNQSEINLIWNAGSTYMAEIDVDEIKFVTSNGETYYATNIKHTDAKTDVFTKEPTLSNNSYYAQLSLEKLNIYTHGAYVDITMQYKNHNDKFYQKATKRIYVDLSAPNTNINNLVSKSISSGLIAPLTNDALRTYYTAKNEQTKDLNKTSYNISNSTGIFAYYSYSVQANYLETLRNTTDTYQIYVREFEDSQHNNTKYVASEEQETAPADFLPSNFTEITKLSNLKANTYYEVVEMDMAGNMTIYTIYITNYSSITNDAGDVDEINEYNNLITYQAPYKNAEGTTQLRQEHYTIEDYWLTNSYEKAIHNVYAKTGFTLEKLNFFGDEWAQIKLTTLNVNGFENVKYLMLTPWDKENAYAFVGNNYSKIAISSLIDGTMNSKYKNTISIYSRENTATTNFYINIRNTSLSASLTDIQTKEYIKFQAINDATIQSTTLASTYLTDLKITAGEDQQILYEKSNKLGFVSLWESNGNIEVTTDEMLGTITFEVRPELGFTPNTRIVYEYTDNYGTTYKEIHLYKETIIAKEISSKQDLYAYYNAKGELIYITKDEFQYSYNPSKYKVEVFDLVDGGVGDGLTNATKDNPPPDSNGIITITISKLEDQDRYNNSFVIEVRDLNNPNDNENLVKTITFTLYNELPEANIDETNPNNKAGQFKIIDANNNNITPKILNPNTDTDAGYFSEVKILFAEKESFIPIKYSISKDKINWEEISSGKSLKCETESMEKYYLKVWYDETYLKNEVGLAQYVFGYIPVEQIYEFNLSSLKSTFWIEKTINGITSIVEKSNTIYKTTSGGQYSNHYIVNVKYANKDAVQIKTNKELGIEAKLAENGTFADSTTVFSELWTISNEGKALGNIPPFTTNIVITYIPDSDNFVEELYTTNMNGIIDTTENLINLTSKNVIIGEDYASINKIQLQWTKYYGIEQNEININLYKDGIELAPTVYTRYTNSKTYNYIYLTQSGKYTITLHDKSGNHQKFNRGNAGQADALTMVFLKDVPFTVTYTNPKTGEEETSAPIKQAVYNGAVTLNIDKNTRAEYYSLDGYPVISVKKNGEEYSIETTNDTTFTFNEPGYYEVSFTATSNLPDVGKIRQETYQFTILEPNEFRYSYIYNRYSNYYVEQVLKNGVDITTSLVKTLDVSTITVNGVPYLAELPLSYLDEKTGAGTYLITINSNDKTFRNSSAITSWTYQVIIQVGDAPIKISLAEGQKTTDKITVTFNQANIFEEMGQCTLRIMRYQDDKASIAYSFEINAQSTEEVTQDITTNGTYYVQIISPSGNLLYSYKVIKNDPLNAAAIIAIVISAVLVIAVIFIIIKLRKRIAVK